MSKLAIFGIDGGSLDLIQQWQDELPTLKRFLDSGVYGNMMSTTPSLTCPAWVSMFTGKNPAKLGMFDFLKHDGSICNSNDYNEQALWSILNRNGISVGMINVPMTYPPHPIDGYMITGLGTPEGISKKYYYPENMKLKGYKITPNVLLTLYGQEDKVLEECWDVVKIRKYFCEDMIKSTPTDVIICTFYISDVIQHYFWRFIDKEHPRYENHEVYRSTIKYVYMTIDRFISKFIDQFNNVIIVSDHSFGSCHGHFVINKWLEEEGYITLKENQNAKLLNKARDYAVSHLSPNMVHKIASVLPDSIRNKVSTMGESRERTLNSIDWDETVAYAIGSSSGGIYIRDERLRLEITNKLEKLGFGIVWKEKVYNGEYLKDAPDIFIELGSSNWYPLAFGETVWQDTALSGSHKKDGLIMALGENIGKGKLEPCSIYDLTPTVLNIWGVEVPDDIDGKVLEIANG